MPCHKAVCKAWASGLGGEHSKAKSAEFAVQKNMYVVHTTADLETRSLHCALMAIQERTHGEGVYGLEPGEPAVVQDMWSECS